MAQVFEVEANLMNFPSATDPFRTPTTAESHEAVKAAISHAIKDAIKEGIKDSVKKVDGNKKVAIDDSLFDDVIEKAQRKAAQAAKNLGGF